MISNSLLIANRGEIAIRIIRAAAEMGIRTVAVFPDDDAASLHTRKADEARRLNGAGAAAYLDGEQIIALARDAGCRRVQWLVKRNNASAIRLYESLGAEATGDWQLMQLRGDALDRA